MKNKQQVIRGDRVVNPNKIGVILPSLHDSQLSYGFIKSINQFIKTTSQYDFVLFCENLSMPIISPMCGYMTSNEISGFDGLLISTDLDNTFLSIRSINAAKKVFYVHDLEWLRGKTNFMYNIQIYRHPDIELICGSESYAKALKNYCNRKAKIITNYDIGEFINGFCK